jgi:hypothetical protein
MSRKPKARDTADPKETPLENTLRPYLILRPEPEGETLPVGDTFIAPPADAPRTWVLRAEETSADGPAEFSGKAPMDPGRKGSSS